MKVEVNNKHQQYLPLILLSSLSCVLLLYRVIFIGGRLNFMVWNLVLAWLPLLFVTLLIRGLGSEKWLSLKNVGLSFLWLIFLPNSFYLVTDFIHLRNSAPANLLFDAVMLMSFALTGLLLGCVSLYIFHRELEKRIDQKRAWFIVGSVLMLSSLAIYLGRFLRWNTWDIVLNPLYILFDLSNRFIVAEELGSTLWVVSLFFCYMGVIYFCFYSAVKAINSKK